LHNHLSIRLEHGEAMIFGKERDRGLLFDPASGSFSVIHEADGPVAERATVHDEANWMLAWALGHLQGYDDLPTALGVIYCVDAEDYETSRARAAPYQPIDRDDLAVLLAGDGAWQVTEEVTEETPAEATD
jgi:2-oxoglutarate ferredoxin oxidoreductase subunit beta